MTGVSGFLFDALGLSGYLRAIMNNTWAEDATGEEVATGHLIHLPSDQDLDVEIDFLTSHLPFDVAALGGIYPNGDPWIFVTQKLREDLARRTLGFDDPYEALMDSFARALSFNPRSTVEHTVHWSRADLVETYQSLSITEDSVASWPVADLIRGLFAQCCEVPLSDLVAGYPTCAFPRIDHPCEHNVFNDVFSAWNEAQLPTYVAALTRERRPSRRPKKKAESAASIEARQQRARRDASLMRMKTSNVRRLAVKYGFAKRDLKDADKPALIEAILETEFPGLGPYSMRALEGLSKSELRRIVIRLTGRSERSLQTWERSSLVAEIMVEQRN